jgi:hypothetical protein
LRIEQGKGYQRRYGQGRCGCGLVVEPLGPEILDVDLEVFAPLVYFCMSPTGSHITVWHISSSVPVTGRALNCFRTHPTPSCLLPTVLMHIL